MQLNVHACSVCFGGDLMGLAQQKSQAALMQFSLCGNDQIKCTLLRGWKFTDEMSLWLQQYDLIYAFSSFVYGTCCVTH